MTAAFEEGEEFIDVGAIGEVNEVIEALEGEVSSVVVVSVL